MQSSVWYSSAGQVGRAPATACKGHRGVRVKHPDNNPAIQREQNSAWELNLLLLPETVRQQKQPGEALCY